MEPAEGAEPEVLAVVAVVEPAEVEPVQVTAPMTEVSSVQREDLEEGS